MSQLDPQTTTVNDLCIAALKECGQIGVGQTALAEDITDAWARLQWMLQQWQQKRWLVYHLVDYAVVATGQEIYTFGPGGQIDTNSVPSYGLQALGLANGGAGYTVGNVVSLTSGPNAGVVGQQPQITVQAVDGGGAITTFVVSRAGQLASPLPTVFTSADANGASFQLPIWNFLPTRISSPNNALTSRPDKVESAFLRQIQNSEPNQVDYPLGILESREDYNRIRLKSLVSFPGAVFMDAAWPLSNVYCYPVAQGGGIYELHVTIKQRMPCRFASLATLITLPYEYYEAIVANLAFRLRSRYQIPSFPGDPLPGMVKDSLVVLRGANTEIAELTIDPSLTRSGLYNIFSDTVY